jgi:hypothetical protein
VYVFDESISGFYFAFVIHCMFQSPRSFWSMSARGWIVDEDAFSNAEQGKTLRRESLVSNTTLTCSGSGSGSGSCSGSSSSSSSSSSTSTDDATELSVPLLQTSVSLSSFRF